MLGFKWKLGRDSKPVVGGINGTANERKQGRQLGAVGVKCMDGGRRPPPEEKGE